MRVLAIDPASNKCGIAVFVDGHLVRTETLQSEKKTPLLRRLDIAVQLVPEIAMADRVISEEPFLQGRNNNGMQRLLGMIEKLCSGQVQFIHPMTIKKNIGHGTLDKMEIAFAVGDLLQTDEEKELLANAVAREAWDETDACAIGLVGGINNEQIKSE